MLELLEKWRSFNTDWFTVKQVKDEFSRKGERDTYLKGIASDLYRLALIGFIDARGVGITDYHVEFRGKREKKTES